MRSICFSSFANFFFLLLSLLHSLLLLLLIQSLPSFIILRIYVFVCMIYVENLLNENFSHFFFLGCVHQLHERRITLFSQIHSILWRCGLIQKNVSPFLFRRRLNRTSSSSFKTRLSNRSDLINFTCH